MYKKYYAFTLLFASILLFGVLGAFLYSENKEKLKEVEYKWKVLGVFKRNTPIYQQGMEKFAKDVFIISNGQLKREDGKLGRLEDGKKEKRWETGKI